MKQKIVEQLKEKIKQQLKTASESFQSAKELTSSEDSKSEGKYDTRAIEAGYLAGAQKQRIDELEKELQLIESIEFHPSNNVSIGSLIEMEFNEKNQLYFLSSTSGGTMLMVENKPILVISAFSPIGNEVVGLSCGESFELETPKETRVYTIKSIS